MATLSPASAAAIARLRSYVPPPTTWYSLPVSRRAAVLILLYADRRGDLRVVLTMRATTLKSYAGQAALPGGKSDTLLETPLQTARREAFEEIGLPMPTFPPPSTTEIPPTEDPSPGLPNDHPHSTKFSPITPSLPAHFQVEHLCQLPTNLAKTELGVRPCVALLSSVSPDGKYNPAADVETNLIPRLDAKEVAAVFSGPLHNFLLNRDEYPVDDSVEGSWYKGSWVDWYATKFRMHNFYVPVFGHAVTRPKDESHPKKPASTGSDGDLATRMQPKRSATQLNRAKAKVAVIAATTGQYPAASRTLPYRDLPQPYTEDNPDPLDTLTRFRVFGMTARILVDCARVAYGEEPDFEHNSHFGDEEIIQRLIDVGKLDTERRRGDEFHGSDLANALQGNGFGGIIREENHFSKL